MTTLSDERPSDSTPLSGLDFTDPHSPLAPYYLQTSHIVAIVLLTLIFLFFSLLPPLFHTDFWGHLRYGQWIAAQRALPQREPFSAFSDLQQSLVHFQWLTQLAYYGLFRAGAWLADGDDANQLAGSAELVRTGHALIVTLRYLLLLIAFRRITASLPLACAGVALAVAFGFTHDMIQRPQAVGELWFAALLAAISGFNTPEVAATEKPGFYKKPGFWHRLLTIPAIFLLWANTHGSFVIGFGLLGLLLVGRAIETASTDFGWDFGAAARDGRTRQLALALLLAAIAVCLNPHGPALYLHVLQTATHANVRQMAEWQPMIAHVGVAGAWPYLLMTTLALGIQGVSKQQPGATWVLLVIVFGFAPLVQQRHYVWWVMLAPWLLLPACNQIAKKPGFLEKPGFWWLPAASIPSFRKTLAAAAVVVLAAVWSSPLQLLLGHRPLPATRTLSRATPYFVMPQIAKALPPGNSLEHFRGRIWTTETLADYWLWSLTDPKPLFVYSHVHLFPAAHWQDHVAVLLARPGWSDILDRQRVNLMMLEPAVRPELAEAVRHHAAWRVVVDEQDSAAKRDPRMRLLVAVRKKPL